MGKIIFSLMIFGLITINPAPAAAFWKSKPAAKAPDKQAPLKVVQPSSDANRKIESRVREILAAKDWLVYLSDADGKKNVTDVDVLTFSEGKFISKSLSNKGYPMSNFTIAVSSDGAVSWETTQMTENGDMAFWKGQLQSEIMSGVLSLHTLKGQLQDFYFTNITAEQKLNIVNTEVTKSVNGGIRK